MQVFVNSEADVDKLSAKFDLAEYKQVEDDGTIQLNIDADPQERAQLRAMGFRIGKTIEDAGTRAANPPTIGWRCSVPVDQPPRTSAPSRISWHLEWASSR